MRARIGVVVQHPTAGDLYPVLGSTGPQDPKQGIQSSPEQYGVFADIKIDMVNLEPWIAGGNGRRTDPSHPLSFLPAGIPSNCTEYGVGVRRTEYIGVLLCDLGNHVCTMGSDMCAQTQARTEPFDCRRRIPPFRPVILPHSGATVRPSDWDPDES